VIDHRHACTTPVQVERRFGRGVLAPDDDRVAHERFVSLAIAMRDMREILARNAEKVRRVEVPGRDHDRTRSSRLRFLAPGPRMDDESLPSGFNVLDALVLPHDQPLPLHDLAIVRQCIPPRRLLRRYDERHSADLDAFRGREERQVRGIAGNR
jgi:hypothetical protein